MLVVLLSQQAYRPGNKTNEQLTDKVTQLRTSGKDEDVSAPNSSVAQLLARHVSTCA
jgi:hypothetical protein